MPYTTHYTILKGAAAFVLVALVVATVYRVQQQDVQSNAALPVATGPVAENEPKPGTLYGRVTTYDGASYEGRLRWGGDEEAFWGNYFNGYKDENPWATQVPLEQITQARRPIEFLGFKISRGERPVALGRPFMARYGDIARVDAIGDGVWAALESGLAFAPDVRVTLKSGTVFNLDRLEAGDFDDGVRVWDRTHGVVELAPGQIRTIAFLAAPQPGSDADRLYGTVHTRQGAFTGFLQWDREETMASDALIGHTADGEHRLRFADVRSLVRHGRTSTLVMLRDGREIILSDTRQVGRGNRGVYVDDPRYGRVLVSWDAFESVDFSPPAPSPRYDDFPPGRPLTGSVTTRSGRRLTGRLVYDLDESETTETLDAPVRGVDYTLPFGMVRSIAVSEHEPTARVKLRTGETLQLERRGDLGDGNAGLLVFSGGASRAEYVPWADIEQIDFDIPEALPSPGSTQ